MNYKGYEIRRNVKTKFFKDGEVLEVDAWGIYANGDFKGSVKTLDQAKAYIDQISQGSLHRPRDRTHVIQKTEYDGRGNVITTKIYRGEEWKN